MRFNWMFLLLLLLPAAMRADVTPTAVPKYTSPTTQQVDGFIPGQHPQAPSNPLLKEIDAAPEPEDRVWVEKDDGAWVAMTNSQYKKYLTHKKVLKITSYSLVCAFDQHDLDERISSLLQQGWEIYGDPCTSARDGGTTFCQAICKKTWEKP